MHDYLYGQGNALLSLGGTELAPAARCRLAERGGPRETRAADRPGRRGFIVVKPTFQLLPVSVEYWTSDGALLVAWLPSLSLNGLLALTRPANIFFNNYLPIDIALVLCVSVFVRECWCVNKL